MLCNSGKLYDLFLFLLHTVKANGLFLSISMSLHSSVQYECMSKMHLDLGLNLIRVCVCESEREGGEREREREAVYFWNY